VEEGLITQEQADEMARRRTLREEYLNRAALMAEALGMTVEELEAARAKGQTLTDLLEAQGLDATTVRDRLEEAHEAALEQAVADGILTQEEADAMRGGFGRGGMAPGGPGTPGAGMRGRGMQRPGCGRGRGGRGGRGGQMPGAPGAGDDTDTGFGPRGGFAPPIEGSDL
jgi:lambda repressor-like predicted transcriptional regulator